jgi:hypothetical protein
MPLHVTALFRTKTPFHLQPMRVCHLIATSLPELHHFAAQLHTPRIQLRWSRAGVPSYLIGPHSRDIALRYGATSLSSRDLASLVRFWRHKTCRTAEALRHPKPYPKTPF